MIDKKIKKLEKLDTLFYEKGIQKVTDLEYDELREELKNLKKGASKEDKKKIKEYLSRTGSKVRESKLSVELPFFIGSLTKVKSDDPKSINTWLKAIEKKIVSLKMNEIFTRQISLLATPKLDGISITLEYTDGKLTNAFTRGDGKKGQSKIQHLKAISSVPTKIKNYTDASYSVEGKTYVRGELVAHKKRFTKLNKKRKEPFKTMLAGTNGWVNADEVDKAFAEAFDFIAYEFIDSKVLNKKVKKPSNVLVMGCGKDFKFNRINFLHLNKFQTLCGKDTLDALTISLPTGGNEYVNVLNRSLKKYKESLDYPVDGLVIEVNDMYIRQELGLNAGNRPEYAKAFKFSAKQDAKTNGQQTKVINIEVNVTKDGAQKPKTVFEPVNINGANVQRATGNNFAWLVEKQIGVGSIVTVVKAGDIVPQVSLHSNPKTPKEILPKVCGCGAKLIHTKADSYCSKPSKCQLTQQALLEYTLKKTKLTGLGAKNIEALFIGGYTSLPKLLAAKEKDLLKLPRFGQAIITTLKVGLPQKLKGMTAPELMEISGVFSKPGLSLAAKILGDIESGKVTKGDRYELYKEKRKEYKTWKKEIKQLVRI